MIRPERLAPFLGFLALISPIFWTGPAAAQEPSPDEIMKSVLSSFSLPLEDLLEKEYSKEWKNLFQGLSGNISYNFPLNQEPPADREGGDTQGDEGRNQRATATFRYNPLSYWFFNVTFHQYVAEDLQAPWDPDFTYQFGFMDWRPGTLSLQYNNFAGNRLFGGGGGDGGFLDGNISASWSWAF